MSKTFSSLQSVSVIQVLVHTCLLRWWQPATHFVANFPACTSRGRREVPR